MIHYLIHIYTYIEIMTINFYVYMFSCNFVFETIACAENANLIQFSGKRKTAFLKGKRENNIILRIK